jgi:hypothetical protein
VTFGLPSWPATLQAFGLVVSPRLGLRTKDNAFSKSLSCFKLKVPANMKKKKKKKENGEKNKIY